MNKKWAEHKLFKEIKSPYQKKYFDKDFVTQKNYFRKCFCSLAYQISLKNRQIQTGK